MSKNKLFINFSLGFLLGVCITNILFVLFTSLIFLSISIFFILVVLIFSKKHQIYIIIFGIGIILGSFLSQYHNFQVQSKVLSINEMEKTQIELKGNIKQIEKIDIDKKSYIVDFQINSYNISGLVYFKNNQKVDVGDYINMKGTLIIPEKIDDFNYPAYLQTKNVYFIVYVESYEITGKKVPNFIGKITLSTQQKLHETLFSLFPENHAALLGGLLFGEKNNLSEDIKQDFNHSGLSHIISVSGFNITIIIIFLGYLFGFLPPIVRSILVSIFVVFFTLLVGYGLPVVRASIMGLLGYYIILSGRKGESLSILLITALIFVCINPYYLNYDVSFQLSFLAVLGLYYCEGFFQKIFYFMPKGFSIKESLVLTMSALSTTIPVMIFHFGQMSIIAPISNILVGATIPITMLFGGLSILGQLIHEKLSYLIGYIEYLLLEYILQIAHICGNIPYASIEINIGGYGDSFLVFYFGILLFLILYFRKEKNPKQ